MHLYAFRPGMRRVRVALAAGAAVLLLGALAAPKAGATSATANLTAGSLAFVSAPPAVSFTATLNGTNQAVPATQPLDVSDATGSGNGWNITATSTLFTSGAHTIAATATTIPSQPSVACDTNVTCTTATTNVTYPYSLPAAATAPTATEMFNATANTGMGDQTVTPTWTLTIPGNTYAGNYTSTWTLSLVSGP
jgi:hypothetical protein